MEIICETLIPDSVIIPLLVAIVGSGGIMLRKLWSRVNKLQFEIASLRAQLALYESCTAQDCPSRRVASSPAFKALIERERPGDDDKLNIIGGKNLQGA